ncbi:hypothetical protein WMY93_031289 [Mugilogobius chulae]|uniref:Uncharacterized protein n=1 Tax=Mugilogobius chulae TaxID=88201 RepID=A0AAW0MIH8_9GOBI
MEFSKERNQERIEFLKTEADYQRILLISTEKNIHVLSNLTVLEDTIAEKDAAILLHEQKENERVCEQERLNDGNTQWRDTLQREMEDLERVRLQREHEGRLLELVEKERDLTHYLLDLEQNIEHRILKEIMETKISELAQSDGTAEAQIQEEECEADEAKPPKRSDF